MNHDGFAQLSLILALVLLVLRLSSISADYLQNEESMFHAADDDMTACRLFSSN